MGIYMDNYLNDILIERFSRQKTFDVADISHFYNEQNPTISRTTINWRIHSLAQAGVIQRIGRGVYRLGKSNPFQVDLSLQMKKTARTIKKEFPYTGFCVWELAAINLFGHNLINCNLLFVDVERDAVDAVYYRLKEKQKNVVNMRKTSEDISDLAGSVCIRPLVSHAPTHLQEQIPVATLEKMLVDLATDKEFVPYQGNEIFSIYSNAFEKYTLNESAMLRYAARKEKRANIAEVINTIKQQ
jgi:predicted transcriptional regulator of viral defense system